MISVVVLYLLCASMFTIAKAVLLFARPIFFIGVRMTVAGMLLLGFDRYKQGKFTAIASSDRWLFAQMIVFHIYLVYVLDLIALEHMASARSALWFSMTPFFTAIIAYFLLGEYLTIKKIIGLAIGFCGVLIEMLSSCGTGQMAPEGVYDMYMLIAVASGAYGWILFKKLQLKPAGYSSFFINGFAMFFAGLCALVTSCYYESWFTALPVTDVWSFALLTSSIIVLGNIMYYSLYGYLLRFYSTTFLAYAGFLCPIFAGCFGWLFLCELLSVQFFISVLCVCCGLYLFYQDELRA